ncbi:MAG: carboxypeptidase-like regulatory domain-containing protein [Candidatus Azobacteroides sp.]|nr:carboxypeptidase-like regulatory domain-containing protein [Candidatus Azobacteroides sp.]
MILRSTLLSALGILFTVSSLNAQIKLSGIVIDADTKNPLEFANVALLNGDSAFIAGTSCDSIGFFVFDNLSQGDYILSSTFVGYGRTYTPVIGLTGDRNLGTVALQTSGVALSEVTVTGSTVIQKVDRKLLIPSAGQIKASNSGLTLLRNMQLSRVVINPVSNTVTTPGGQAVQLRINGVEVTTAEVVALQPQDIIRIEYYEDPGMRYGDAAAVIDYITRRRDSGGSLSANLSNALWRLGFAEDYFSAKVNHKKSEFGVNAYFHYRDLKWTRENHETFVFPDRVLHRDEIGKPTKVDEKSLNLALNYNLNEPDKYLFNATFRNNYNNTPNQFSDRISTLYSTDDSIPSSVSDHSTWWNNAPSLDLYFQRNLKNDQLIILNAVGTYMDSKSTRLYQQERTNEESYISYSRITGNKYSLIAEGIYEKKWENGKLTGGLRHTQSYTENDYTGNVSRKVGLNVSQTYGYAEFQLRKNKFNYALGLGAMRTFDSQDNNSVEKYIFRPTLRVSYNINTNTYIRYNGYVSGYPPSLSDLNDVTQNIDALQIQQGNPNLQTVWFVSNDINAGYNKGIFGLELFARYSYDHQPIMESITFSDSSFIHTNVNQRAFHRFYSQLSLKLKPWKDHITLNLAPSFNRYVSMGTDYQHTYNYWRFYGSLLATYKNWSFNAEGYTRWYDFWGETLGIDEKLIILTAGYNTPRWGVSVMMLNPFTNEYSLGNKGYSSLVPYISNVYTHNLGQIIAFNFSLNLNFGRKYNAANKRLDNTDTDAGIMTGAKK